MNITIAGCDFGPPIVPRAKYEEWQNYCQEVYAYLKNAEAGKAKRPEQHRCIFEFPFIELSWSVLTAYKLTGDFPFPHWFIVAFGDNRLGKDTSLCAVAIHEAGRRPGALLSYTGKTLRQALANYKTGQETAEICMVADVLHVADFDDAKWGVSDNDGNPSTAMDHFFEIIDHRFLNRLMTCLSTNRIDETLWTKFHPVYRKKLAGRIREAAYFVDFDDMEWSFEAEVLEMEAKFKKLAWSQARREIRARQKKEELDAARAMAADAKRQRDAATQAEADRLKTITEAARCRQEERQIFDALSGGCKLECLPMDVKNRVEAILDRREELKQADTEGRYPCFNGADDPRDSAEARSYDGFEIHPSPPR